MGMNAPKPPDFNAVQGKENAANRPNQTNAFGSSSTWNADGSQTQSFGGPLGGAANSLMGQAGQSLSNPLDFSGLGAVGNGDQARDQAIDAAYKSAVARLDPQWDKRMEGSRTQLLNQGLDPASEAYKNQQSDLGMQRNDAYQGAFNNAVMQGVNAGHVAFGDNMAARQQGIAEILRQRGQSLSDLGGLQGLLQQQGFNQSSMLPAAMAQHNANSQAQQQTYQNWVDAIQGGAQVAGSIAPFFL